MTSYSLTHGCGDEESSSSSSRWHAQVGKCWNGNRDCLPFFFVIILLIDTIDIYRLYRFYMMFYRFYMMFYIWFSIDSIWCSIDSIWCSIDSTWFSIDSIDVLSIWLPMKISRWCVPCGMDQLIARSIGWVPTGYSQISPLSSWISHSHRIHGAGIYANIGDILMGSMLPYIAYMDPMGLKMVIFSVIFHSYHSNLLEMVGDL